MDFYKKYSICLLCILAVLFFGSCALGSVLSSDCGEEKGKQNIEESTGTQKQDAVVREYIPAQGGFMLMESEGCYDIALSKEKQDYVTDICREYGVLPELVFAIMDVSCGYVDGQISRDGDWGIMQINSVNHEWLKSELKVENILSFRDNVLCGVYMLSGYSRSYGDISMVAMCYRYGESAARRMWQEGIYETEYTREIMNAIASLNYI